MRQWITKRLAQLLFLIALSTPSFAHADARVGNGIYEFTASDHYNFVWFRITKNGSRSTVAALRHRMRGYVDVDHQGICQTPYNYQKYENHFKFAFVRNPWERTVSCYFGRVCPGKYYPLRECFDKSFEEFVDWIAEQDLSDANIHITPQSSFIPPGVELDFIGRVENFDDDLQAVMSRFGIVMEKAPHRNTSDHKHYSHYYNDRTREIIRQLYEEDIVRFGYEFEYEE